MKSVKRGKLLIMHVHMMQCRPIILILPGVQEWILLFKISVTHGHATILAPLPAQTTPTHKSWPIPPDLWEKESLMS